MFSISRLFPQKAFFSFLIMMSLSSILSATYGEDEESEIETRVISLSPREQSEDIFEPAPPSSLWGKSMNAVWTHGGGWIDKGIIFTTTYAGACLGSMADSAVANYFAELVGARPVMMGYNYTQFSTLSNDSILPTTRRNTLRKGTPEFGFPYDDLATVSGATAGYFFGKGITLTRRWIMEKVTLDYRPIKNWVADTLSYWGWKMVDKSKEMKED